MQVNQKGCMQTLNEQIHCSANVDVDNEEDDDEDDKDNNDFNSLKFTNKLKSLFNFNPSAPKPTYHKSGLFMKSYFQVDSHF